MLCMICNNHVPDKAVSCPVCGAMPWQMPESFLNLEQHQVWLNTVYMPQKERWDRMQQLQNQLLKLQAQTHSLQEALSQKTPDIPQVTKKAEPVPETALVNVKIIVKESLNPVSYAKGTIFHFVVDGVRSVNITTGKDKSRTIALQAGIHSVVMNKITGCTGTLFTIRCEALHFEVSPDRPITIAAPNISVFSSSIKLKIISG